MEVREEIPKKSFSGEKFKTYKTNKKYLAIDFNNRCAYCNDPDIYSGGYRNFHVDHFAPKSLFPSLEFNYDNLFYCCPFCNCAKSNKWVSNSEKISVVGSIGFLNPCEEEYYKHIKRLDNGNLIYTDLLGRYIYENLALGLQRHKYIFFADSIHERIEKIKKILKTDTIEPIKKRKIQELHYELLCNFYEYWKKIY